MSTPFIPRDYSLREEDLIPAADVPEHDQRWQDYCTEAKRVNIEDLMAVVLDALSTSPVLRGLIEDIQAHPFEPGERWHLHPMENIRLGDEVARLIDTALDDLVSMKPGWGEPRCGREGR